MSYFTDLFGTPEVTRLENWDGKEKPLSVATFEWQQQQPAAGFPLDLHASELYDAESTLDIDHEEVS